MKLLRLEPGHGEIVLAEGDVEVPEEERELIEEFRRQLDLGMAAAVPVSADGGRRQAELVKSFEDVPREAERVIFFSARRRRVPLRIGPWAWRWVPRAFSRWRFCGRSPCPSRGGHWPGCAAC